MTSHAASRTPVLKVRSKRGISYGYARFDGREVSFGRVDDPTTQVRFDEMLASWLTNGRRMPEPEKEAAAPISVRELTGLFLDHLQRTKGAHYDLEVSRIKRGLAFLLDVAGKDDAQSFGPKRLKVVRESMILSKRFNRATLNRLVRYCLRVFQWGSEEEIVRGIWHDLDAVPKLKMGDDARVPEEGSREAVAWEDVEPVLPRLPSAVRALVELQWHCGARPSELYALTKDSVDRTTTPWVVRLKSHKTSKKGGKRELYLNAEARKVLEPFMSRVRAADATIFSPRDSWLEAHERRTGTRYATPTGLRDRYDSSSYGQAIRIAQNTLNEERAAAGEDEVPRWSAYQLRHAFGHRMRKAHGLDATAKAMGHSQTATTERSYAGTDVVEAAHLVEQLGNTAS